MTEQEKLIQMVKENESVKRYKKLEEVINKNTELKSKIGQLKTIQKQLINAQKIEKTKTIQHFQTQYDQLLEEIESYPLMSDYLALQSDINEMIQHITKIIEDGINEELNRK